MKYFRILFLFGLALFCGSVASHANTFHAGALDPACNGDFTQCGLGVSDLGQPLTAALSQAACSSPFISPPLGGLPDPTVTPYGCFVGINLSGQSIASITLDFNSIDGVTGCDTDLPDVTATPIFTNNSCSATPGGGIVLSFSGGPGVPTNHVFIILEEGVDPDSFTGGTVTAAATPEPDSLLLLSTGTLMMGLYLAGRTRMFAFLKK
jgi:hypothetical protein